MTLTNNNRSKALSFVARSMKNNIDEKYGKRYKGHLRDACQHHEDADKAQSWTPRGKRCIRKAKESEAIARRAMNGAIASAQAIHNLRGVNKKSREWLNTNEFKKNINKKNFITHYGPRSLGYLRTLNTAGRNSIDGREFRQIRKRAMRQERGGVNLLPDHVFKKFKVDEMENDNYNLLMNFIKQKSMNYNSNNDEFKLYNSRNRYEAMNKVMKARRRHTPLFNKKLFDFNTMTREDTNKLIRAVWNAPGYLASEKRKAEQEIRNSFYHDI